ncbi:MAG: ddc 2 [Gemmatimonadetes bacterium]|nr:ddc 2 [Gemmatimonadota bacterium]
MSDRARAPLGDIPADELQASIRRVADWATEYRMTVAERAIMPSVQPGDIALRLGAAMPAHGDSMDAILDDLDTVIMPGILHWGHPTFLGYYGSTSNGPALVGEIAAAALNVSAMTWKTSPAATELEATVLAWIRDLLGLSENLFGVVYDTASVALLHALAAAREASTPNVRSHGLSGAAALRVYASEQAHSSLVKAMVMLGLGAENVVRVPTDDAFRMDAGMLRAAMVRDAAMGLRPMAVVATVGTTSCASVDPVAHIAAICQEWNVWLHVDAAYGGALAALPEARWILDGLDTADSIIVNPHKWLFVPLDFSVLYLRHPDIMRTLFMETPEYLEGDAQPASQRLAPDYMDYGIQLGRRFRALKAWMVLRAFGHDGISARIREHCRLAAMVAEWVEATPEFELIAPLSMAVVCFRHSPAGESVHDGNARNIAIVNAVNATGAAYLTYTSLNGKTCMRIGVGNIATTEQHIRQLCGLLTAEARRSREDA